MTSMLSSLESSPVLSTMLSVGVGMPLACCALFLVVALLLGPYSKSWGSLRTFYGEDARHAEKKAEAYHGFRLLLKPEQSPVDVAALRARMMEIVQKEGSRGILRVRMLSTTKYTFSDAPAEEVVNTLLHVGVSGIDEPGKQLAVAEHMWVQGLPLRVYVDGNKLDLVAHHAVADGVRGVRILNQILGNFDKKGAIRPQDLPCCLLACRPLVLGRIMAFERPAGQLHDAAALVGATPAAVSAPATDSPIPRVASGSSIGFHESHYLRIPTALIKKTKETHGLGFAAALQGTILWTLFRCNTPKTLHVATSVGFKSDWWARLGSAFNHYGAFPFCAKDGATPQDVAKAVTKGHKRNGMASGFGCLLANASCGGASGLSSVLDMKEMYRKIDVLIGGGPLILDPSCGYDTYSLFKFHHTVPVYIFYATLCDEVQISVQSRVPMPNLEKAFAEAIEHLKPGSPTLKTAPSKTELAFGHTA